MALPFLGPCDFFGAEALASCVYRCVQQHGVLETARCWAAP